MYLHKQFEFIIKKYKYVTPVNTFQNGTGDANDVWKVFVIGDQDGAELQAVTSKLKFIHYLQSCILTASGKQLPKWAYEQQEVSCNPNLRDPNAVWNVEENFFDKRIITPPVLKCNSVCVFQLTTSALRCMLRVFLRDLSNLTP